MLTRGWRSVACTMVTVALCPAQAVVPAGPVDGDLLDWSGDTKQGELVFRNAENRVFQCSFDDQTRFERADRPAVLSASDKGARVEVLPDVTLRGCYVKAVRFTPVPAHRTGATAAGWPDWARVPLELISARGDLTFSGVVVKVGPQAVLLRTRRNERKLILLRPDTRYLGEGQGLERGNLEVNMLVFVRAGKNFEDQVEAYQIVWGEILEPILAPSGY